MSEGGTTRNTPAATDDRNGLAEIGTRIGRRAFVRGLGLAATSTAIGGAGMLLPRHLGAATGSGTLSDAPVVMIWRRTTLNLATVQSQVEGTHGWPAVGQDAYSLLYDAGNVLVGYWNQADYLAAGVALEAECSGLSRLMHPTAFNPSNQLTLAVDDTGAVARRLSKLAGRAMQPAAIKGPLGQAVTFVDSAGNTTRYLRLSNDAAKSGLGPRLKSLQDSGQRDASSPVVGYELLVSDLPASRRFYTDVLGLTVAAEGPDSVAFDAGNLLLTLRMEPAAGMVSAIKMTGKLGDDLVNFHRPDVQGTFLELRARGVRFPRGIEDSSHGRVAVFEDPDGHTLAIWQPPPRFPEPEVNYFPVLDRILGGATGG